LAPGKLADIAVFAGDPTKQIALMEKAPQLVMIGGQKIEQSRLAS